MTPRKSLTRHRYLALLRKMNSATADEFARALHVTPANARYHLAGLQTDGLVEVIEKRPGKGRGRPVKIYGLSRSVRGDNLPNLLDAILLDWLSLIDSDDLEDALKRVAQSMVKASQFTVPGNFARKLAIAMEQLNKMRYDARWEAHASGPHIIFESCPYSSVISQHPEICKFDAKLLEQYLGTGIEQRLKLDKMNKSIPICLFAIVE